MKKIVLLLTGLLVVAYPAFAWLNGRYAEAEFRRLADATDAAQNLPVLIDRHYRRGWFQSDFELTFRPGDAPAQMTPLLRGLGDFKLIVHGVVHHGPLAGLTCLGIARTELTLVLDDAVRERLKPAFGSGEPVTISSCSGYLGGTTTTVRSPKFAHPLPLAGVSVDSDGFSLTSRSRRDAEGWTAEGRLPRLEVQGPGDQHALLRGLTFAGRQTQVAGGLYDGPISFGVEALTANGPGGKTPIELKAFSVASATESSGGYTSVRYSIGFGALNAATYHARDAHFDMTIGHLDTGTLKAMAEGLRRINADQALQPSERGTQTMAAMKSYLTTLLAHAPVLDLTRVSVDTDKGRLSVAGSVRAPGVTEGDQPADAMKRIEADFDLAADDGLLGVLMGSPDKRDEALDHAVAQGFVTRSGGHTATHVRLRNGAVMLNDKPYP